MFDWGRDGDCKSSLLDVNLLTHTYPYPYPGLTVESYGTGTQVRLPGKSAMEPRIFKFGTPYAEMYRSLSATPEDETYFQHNGVLQLCKRGSSVKVCYEQLEEDLLLCHIVSY